MEAAQPTKAQFLKEKMTNLLNFLYDRLDTVRLQFPELEIETREEALKNFNEFESEELALAHANTVFDNTKHFCLNILGGVELVTEGNSKEITQTLFFVRNVASMVISQSIMAKRLSSTLAKKKETGEIPPEATYDVADPNAIKTLLNEQERIELLGTVKNVSIEIMKVMQDADWLRICAYINCFVDIVTNL